MSDFALILQWSLAVLIGVILLSRGQLTIFHPPTIYLAFHVLVFCVRPTLLYLYDFDTVWGYMKFRPTDDDLARSLLASSVGLIVYTLFFCINCPYRGVVEFGHHREVNHVERRIFWYVLLIFVPLGLASIFFADVQGQRVGGAFIMTGTSGYINDAQQVFVSLTVLFVFVNRWKWWSFLPLLFFLYFRATEGWARWTMVLTVIALVLVHAWENKKSLPSWKFLVPGFFLAIIFMNMGHDRMWFRNFLRGVETEHTTVLDEEKTIQERFDTLDFANYDYLTYITAVVPKMSQTGPAPYTYGTQYLGLFTEPIPRQIWPNKPIGGPVALVNLNAYGNFNGLTNSIIGDGWLSGGWIGLIITMALAGFALAKLYNWFVHNQHNLFVVLIYIIIQSMIIQFYRDGGISIAKFLLFTTLPIFAWWFLCRKLVPGSELLEYQSTYGAYYPQHPQQPAQTYSQR